MGGPNEQRSRKMLHLKKKLSIKIREKGKIRMGVGGKVKRGAIRPKKKAEQRRQML